LTGFVVLNFTIQFNVGLGRLLGIAMPPPLPREFFIISIGNIRSNSSTISSKLTTQQAFVFWAGLGDETRRRWKGSPLKIDEGSRFDSTRCTG
jgi:hypothetical protein